MIPLSGGYPAVIGPTTGELLSNQGAHVGDGAGKLPPGHGMVALGAWHSGEQGPGSQHLGLISSLLPINCMTLGKMLHPRNCFRSSITGLLMVLGVVGKTECDVFTAMSPVPCTQEAFP